jgi:hypothetical protein
MAIQIIPIIKAITPLLAASGGIVKSLTAKQFGARTGVTEDRIKKLEEDLLKMSEVVQSTVEQLQATANELRIQYELNQSKDSRLRFTGIVSTIALCLGVASIVISIMAL